jgi:hypothetical protein
MKKTTQTAMRRCGGAGPGRTEATISLLFKSDNEIPAAMVRERDDLLRYERAKSCAVRSSFGQIERDDAKRPFVLPGDQVTDDRVAIRMVRVRLHKGVPVLAKVAEHKMKVVTE